MKQEEIIALVMQYVVPIAGALALFVLAIFIANRVQSVAKQALLKAKLDETLASFLSKVARWLVLIMAVLSSLSAFGIETTSFAAVIGAAGLAIGLAFQGTLANAASGVMILVFRPYSVGDLIQAGGVTGSVRDIDLFSTSLDTLDNRRYIIPNSELFGSTIENMSYHSDRRCDVTIGVSYDADIDEVREILLGLARKIEPQLEEREPSVALVNLGGSSVDFSVRVWCKPSDYLSVKESILVESKKALDAAEIGIPYPQMDIHMVEMPEKAA